MKQAVQIDHLNFSYQNFRVLNNVSLHIDSGQFVSIIGPNGGGKTTLLRLIMGFLKPLSGTVKIFGESPDKARALISYVPQTLRFDKLFPISVMEVVLMGRLSHLPWYGIYRKTDRRAALEALEKVGMEQFQSRAFGTLSGGQLQRTLIARALVSHPKLLLLDEPTASVDAEAQAEIYSLLKQLRGDITLLMVTHDLDIAVEHVEKVICVQNHVTTLSPKEVCEHYAFGLYHTPLIPTIGPHKKLDK